MDQPALSFGEGHYESLTLFTTQLAPEELAKQTSIDKLEIPDEKVVAYLPEHGFLTSSILNIPNSLTLNNSQQIRHKSTGKLRGMLNNKENMSQKEREESPENNRTPLGSLGENQPIKINQPFATQSFAKKPPVNASFQGLRSSGGFSESSFVQENKKQAQDRSFDNRLSFQPPSEKAHSRKQSQGNLRIEVENSNTTPAVTTPAATEVMKDITSKQAEQMNYSRPTRDTENKEDKKQEAKPMRKRTPKKVEISLAFGADTMKHEQPEKQEEKVLPPLKVEQTEQRRSAWNSRERLSDQEEPPFRALSRERPEPSNRSLSKASFTEQDVSIEKRESYPKKPTNLEEKHVHTEQAPISRPVYGIKDDSTEGKIAPEEKTVYQRLFEMNKSRRGFKGGSVPALNDSETYNDRTNSFAKNDSNFYMKNSFTFQPKLESKSRYMKRDEKVDTLLYKDAIRRQNKSLENIGSQTPTPSNYTLHQSNKLMAKKFIREFEEEISAFFGIAQERKFDYNQLTEFLKTMKFVKGLQDLSTHAIHEKTLVDMIWSILKGDKYHGVNERNLLLFLLAIMGLHLDIPSYTPKTTVQVTPNVSDKFVLPIQVPKIDSSTHSEVNPSEKRESMWKKRQEAELAEAMMKNAAQENEPEKETVAIADIRSPSVNSNATTGHAKNKLSLTSDHTENAEPSLGISNILAQKLSFQSEHTKQPESQVFVEPEVHQEDNLVGTFDNEENIAFTEEEVQRIAQTYEMFYSNRLYASKSLTKKISQSQLDASFEPEILEYSRQLAFNYREKQLQNLEEIIVDLKDQVPYDKRVTHADLLIYKGLSTKNKLSQQRQQSMEKQLEACTFRPNLAASTRTPGRKTIKFDKEKEEPYHSRGEHLYNLAKKSGEKAKVERSTRQTELRKNNESYTFKPDLEKSRRSQSRSKVKAQNVSKDFDKSVERMKRGREQREQVRMATENRAQKLDDKSSQFKFTLEKIHGRKESISSTKKDKLNTSNVESVPNKKVGYMSFVNGQRGEDSSFGSFDTRENYQNFGPEPEELIYQANIQNNNKILDESNYNQNLNKFLSQTYGNLTEDPTTTQTLFMNKAQEKIPLLFIDINFGGNKSERIAVYDGDTAEGLATQFATHNNLNDHLKSKLTMLLQSHMSGILSKIEEEMPSTQSEIHRVPPQGSHAAYTNKFR